MKAALHSFIRFALLFFLTGFLPAQVLNPLGEVKPGDFIEDSVLVFDTSKKPVYLKIPTNSHLVILRYAWHDIGRGMDSQDSLKELEARVSKIIAERKFKKTQVVLLSYDRAGDFEKWAEKITAEQPFASQQKFSVAIYNTNGNNESEKKLKRILSKVTMFGPTGRILRYASYISRFDYPARSGLKTNLKGKLLGEGEGLIAPLQHAFVHLESTENKDTIATATTDAHGEFELNFSSSESEYVLRVKPADEKVKKIILATRDGREVSKIDKGTIGFEYHLLKPAIMVLSEMQADDITLKFESFNVSPLKEMITVESIFYEMGKSDIRPESEKILEKVLKLMSEHPGIRLEIISHTDAQGDEASNLRLSEKRAGAVAAFLFNKGVSPERLKTTGKGESELRNRCTNGVECSDKEHEYNRRTEFIFSK